MNPRNDKVNWWQAKYTWFTITTVIIAFIFIYIMYLASEYDIVLVLNQQVLIGLLSVEATVTGFFGLIFVNGLSSFRGTFEMLQKGEERNTEKSERARENRANISEEQYRQTTQEVSHYSNAWMKAIMATNKNKSSFVNHSLIAGISLGAALFIAILSQAINSLQAVFWLSYLSIGILLFVSLPQIFWSIRDLGRDPYQDWNKDIFKTNA
jgi:hypothetical protein